MRTYTTSIFKDANVAKLLSHLHGKYAVVHADTVNNNSVFAYK